MPPRPLTAAWTRRQFVRGVSLGALAGGTPPLGPRPAAAAPAAAPGGFGKAKSCVLVFLWGGPSHIDTFDMKPDAPAEIRGEFRPAPTAVPGLHWCEHLPRTARAAGRVAVVRSLTQHGRGGLGDHHTDAYYLLTGQPPTPADRAQSINRKPRPDDWPFLGSAAAYARPPAPGIPGAVAVPKVHGEDSGFVVPGQTAGRLGPAYDPLLVRGRPDPAVARGFLPDGLFPPALGLPDDLTPDRVAGRNDLLGRLDGVRERGDGWGGLRRAALGLLAADRVRRAFDLGREPDRVRRRYGPTVNGQGCLLARRLVEAGVPFVCVHWSAPEVSPLVVNWDTHADNFPHLRDRLLPEFDRVYSALLDDLGQRGLLDSTLVVAVGEMGRTPRCEDPRVRGTAYGPGRDHWANCQFALLAGGGVRGGAVYGASDKRAAYPRSDPVYPGDLAATVYHALGIGRDRLAWADRLGRPTSLLDEGTPLPLF